MNLEDHIGDVLRKLRLARNANAKDLASASGLSESDYTALEGTGAGADRLNFDAVATLLKTDGNKLKAISSKWMPAPVEIEKWSMLRRFTSSANDITVNCYLAWDEISREAALFDTGWDSNPILKTVQENELNLRHLFITHTHEDHIAAMAPIKDAFPKIRIHSSSKNAPVTQRNLPQDFIHLGSLRITNRATPGHAEDGTTFVIGNWPEDLPHVAIVGDAIFAGSIGTGNQSWETAIAKVKEQIFSLPDDTLICPGHGPLTTVGEEKKHNPFF